MLRVRANAVTRLVWMMLIAASSISGDDGETGLIESARESDNSESDIQDPRRRYSV